ncbi:hypothetical protein N865_12965 [Intrasporangium oryzae NRRL B-24470]|uniref:TauD/TfdA-like domain-containing protein n=1 Tax=Intrasporangium oryzae NRRL B-24470 TaxID=1386089 RepID=W9G4N3_9MICO|nr:hypothetical protein N865_12965 [Intrasporangium oryzae NRRL B-24470]
MAAWHSPAAAVTRDRVIVLTDADVAEVLAARDAVRRASLPLLGVRRADFPLPALGARLARLAEELEGGHGHAVVRGIPLQLLSEADERLVLWGLGRHVGIAVSQDPLGRLIRPADTSRTDFHSGGSDVTALLVRDEGRTISLTGAGRVVDEIVLSRPELAMRLFDAFHHDRGGEEEPREKPYRSVPLACRHDGRLSLRYDRRAIESGQRFSLVPRLAGADVALLDLIDETAAAPAWRHDLHLQAGDLLLINNYEVLHRHGGSRGAAVPEPLRLWITLRHGRLLPTSFTWPTPAYGETGGRGGIAPRDVVDRTHGRTAHPDIRR